RLAGTALASHPRSDRGRRVAPWQSLPGAVRGWATEVEENRLSPAPSPRALSSESWRLPPVACRRGLRPQKGNREPTCQLRLWFHLLSPPAARIARGTCLNSQICQRTRRSCLATPPPPKLPISSSPLCPRSARLVGEPTC